MKFGQLHIDPLAYGSQGSAVLGIRDSGKTYTATLLAERLFDAGIPFVAFDPVGVWRFLRVPGAGHGYPVVVAGGQEGDLTLSPATAPAIVEASMQQGISLVIDLFSMELSKADWRKIVRDCVTLLLHRNKPHGMRHVFIEEAAEFCPQKIWDGEVYAAVEKLARMGGNSRLGYTLINQRAEEVNKAVLELCDNLFLHRQKGKNSLLSLQKWLDVGNAKDGKEIIDSLPTLPSGECWAWLAGTERPVLVKVPAKNSLHPDRRVMRDTEAAPAAAVDVGQFVASLQSALPKIEAEAKANDPKSLKARIAELEEIVEGVNAGILHPVAPTDEQLKAARAQAYRDGYQAGYEEGFETAVDRGKQAIEALSPAAVPDRPKPEPIAQPAPPARPISVYRDRPAPPRPPKASREPGSLPGGALPLLQKACELYPVRLTWGQLCTLLNRKARGGTFNHHRKIFLDDGLIEEQGDLAIPTDKGFAVAVVEKRSRAMSTAAMNALWLQSLPNPANRMFGALLNTAREWTTVEQLATALGMAGRGGQWNDGVATLRRNALIEVRSGDKAMKVKR